MYYTSVKVITCLCKRAVLGNVRTPRRVASARRSSPTLSRSERTSRLSYHPLSLDIAPPCEIRSGFSDIRDCVPLPFLPHFQGNRNTLFKSSCTHDISFMSIILFLSVFWDESAAVEKFNKLFIFLEMKKQFFFS